MGFTDRVLGSPMEIVEGNADGAEEEGGIHDGETVTVVAALSAGVLQPNTRTEY